MGYLDTFGSGADDVVPSWNELLAGTRRPKLTYDPIRYSRPVGQSSVSADADAFESDYTQGQFTQAQGLNEKMDALDLARDAGGKTAGFASGVFDWADNLRAATMGMVTGNINTAANLAESVGIENPLDEWTDAPGQDPNDMELGIVRAWKGLTNQETYGAGDFDGPLKMNDDDPLWAKALKGAGAFTIDVAADPLTYVSFGAASVGRKIAAEAVDKTAQALAKDLTEDAAKSVATRHWSRGLKETAGTADDDVSMKLITDPDAPLITKGRVVHAADRDNYGYIVTPGEKKSTVFFRSETGATAVKELDNELLTKASKSKAEKFANDIVQAVPDDVAAAQVLGSEAAEAYVRGGAQGLKRYIDDSAEMTFEQKQKLWESLPRDVRGGLRIRVPFFRDADKSPIVLGVGSGGGDIAGKLGLGSILEKANAARFGLRTSRPVQALTAKTSGESGARYNEMLRGLKSGEPSRTTYGIYSTLKDASRQERMLLAASGRETIERLTEVTSELEADGVDKVRATEQLTELFNDRARATALNADEAANPTEAAAIRGAQAMHKMLDEWKEKAEAEGLDLGDMSDYVTRLMTEEAKQSKGRLAKANLKGTATIKPVKGRSGYGTRMVWDPEKKQLNVEARPVTEINAERIRNGEEAIFDEDPFTIMLSYGKAMNRVISSKRIENMLVRNGLVTTVPKGTVREVDTWALRDLKRTTEKSWKDYIKVVSDRKESLGTKITSITRQLEKSRKDLEQMRTTAQQEPLWTDEALADEDFLSGLNAYIDQVSPGISEEGRQAVIDKQLRMRERVAKQDDVLRRIGALEKELADATGDVDAIDAMIEQSLFNEGKFEDLTRAIGGMTEVEAVKSVDSLMTWLTHNYTSQKDLLRRLNIPEDKAGVNPADGLLRQPTRDKPDLVKALDAAGYGRLGTDASRRQVTLPGGSQFNYDEYWATEGARMFVADWFNKTSDSSLARLADTYYAPVYSLWKTWATVGRGPGYLARNLIGGIWNNHLIDATVRDHDLSRKLAKQVRKARRTARETHPNNLAAQKQLEAELLTGPDGALGKVKVAKGATLADVYRIMQEQDLYQTTTRLETMSIDTLRSGEDAIDAALRDGTGYRLIESDRLAARALNKANNNVWTNANMRWAQNSEEWLRGAAVIAGVRRYGLVGDGQPAGLLAKVAHFDYADLSPFERRVMRNIMPFYTWTRNNIPLQLRALINEPGKALNLMRFQETMKDILGGEEDVDGVSWEELMPPYFRNKMGFVTQFTTPGGPLVLGLESPLTDLNTFLPSPDDPMSAFTKGKTTAIDSLNPFAKTILSLATDTDAGTGAPLNDQGMKAPAWTKALEGIPGVGDALINYDKKADGTVERRVNNLVGLLTRDLLPPLGQFERVALPAAETAAEAVTGQDIEWANPDYMDRKVSSWASFLGFPVFTATDGQVAATLADSNAAKRKTLDNWLVKNNVDEDKLEEAIKLAKQRGYGKEWLQAFIASGALAPDPQ